MNATINTLNQLAEYINASEDYNNAVIEEACERNGWILGEDEWHIASNGEEQVIFNDRSVAVVVGI